MKKLKPFYLIFFVIIVFTTCKKDDNATPESNIIGPGEIRTTGQITLPMGTSEDDVKIIAGLNEGNVRDGNYEIELNKDAVQLLSVVNENDETILLSINVIKENEQQTDVNARTTAEALVFLNPFFCTSDISESEELKTRIRALSSFSNLVDLIQSQIDAGTISLSENNTALVQAIDQVYKELSEKFESQLDKKLENILKSFSTSPDGMVNGLSIIDLKEENGEVLFKVENIARRWINIYLDKSTDGINFEPAGDWIDLIPSPKFNVWDIFTDGTPIVPVQSNEISFNKTENESVAVRCYGMGYVNELSEEELGRAILPAAMSIVLDIGFPIFEIISGFPMEKPELRGKPVNNPTYKLIMIAKENVKDQETIELLYDAYRERDISKITNIFTHAFLRAIIDNPRIVTDLINNLLANVLKENVSRVVVNNLLYPIKIINASVTAINLGYALASVFSTQAVTTFIIDKNSIEYPVTSYGVVKDFVSGIGVEGATVQIYDENDRIIDAVQTDANGNYSFKSNTGTYKLIINAYYYKSTEQEVVIPDYVLTLLPPSYTIRTLSLSRFSSLPGDVGGIVKDATDLSTIQGVTVELRYGVNDPNEEIVQTTTSDNSGNYSFSSIPSGTYTAYFSKEGYIDDFMVITVIGNMSTSGFDMTLSPNIITNSGYRIVLIWGESPYDLDSHLFTPDISGNQYHVYFADEGDLYNPPFAILDVDDVSSYGPETITISQTFDGDYYYSVYQYSSDGNLSSSSATINLYGKDGFIQSWNVPLTGSGLWWNVFKIDGSNGTITSINQLSDYNPLGSLKFNQQAMKAK